jgi:hypothetical protein
VRRARKPDQRTARNAKHALPTLAPYPEPLRIFTEIDDVREAIDAGFGPDREHTLHATRDVKHHARADASPKEIHRLPRALAERVRLRRGPYPRGAQDSEDSPHPLDRRDLPRRSESDAVLDERATAAERLEAEDNVRSFVLDFDQHGLERP